MTEERGQCSQSCARAASNIALPPETRSSSRSWPARPATRSTSTDVLLAGEGGDLKSTAGLTVGGEDRRPGQGRQGHGVQEAPPPQLSPQGRPSPAAHDPRDRLDRRQEGRQEGRAQGRAKPAAKAEDQAPAKAEAPAKAADQGRQARGQGRKARRQGRKARRKGRQGKSTKDAAPAKAAAKKAAPKAAAKPKK